MKKVSILQKMAQIAVILVVFIVPSSFCQGYSLVPMTNPDPSYNILNAVQVLNSNIAFAVGQNGTFLKLNGGTWSLVPTSFSNKNLSGISATSATDALICGSGGFVAHYNGSSLTQQTIGTNSGLCDIKRSGSKAYVCGLNGAFWCSVNNGTTWTQVMTGIYNVSLYAMFIDAVGNIWLVGNENSSMNGKLFFYNGSSFMEKASISGLTAGQGIGSIWSPDGNIFYIPTKVGVYMYNNSTSILSPVTNYSYSYVYGLSASSIIFSNSSSGDISLFNGISSWQNIGTVNYIYDISASGPSNVIFVGYNGAIYHLDMTTGLNDQSTAASSFSIYPNPAQSDITLSLDIDHRKDACVELYNNLGQKVAVVTVSDVVHLSVADLPRGLYFVRVKVGETIETKKVLLN